MARKRATLEELLEFANKVRNAGGGNPLDALMPAVPAASSECLIAKNLNFNCKVYPIDCYGSHRWVMWVDTRVLRDKIAEAIGALKVNNDEMGNKVWGIVLPNRIGQIAHDFDYASDTIHLVNERLEEGSDDVFEEISRSEMQVAAEMWPYIDESVKEALSIGQINANAELIL